MGPALAVLAGCLAAAGAGDSGRAVGLGIAAAVLAVTEGVFAAVDRREAVSSATGRHRR